MRAERDHGTYHRLINLLASHQVAYRELEHAPEGRTELVSALRGHPVAQAAKCVVVLVKVSKKTKRYVVAVVPGDKRVDLARIKGLFRGSYAGFADNDIAERLSGSASGTILPFAFDSELDLIVDPELTRHPEIFFNAARLDRSLALDSADYLRIAEPRLEPIAQPVSPPSADPAPERGYSIHLESLFGALERIDVPALAASVTDSWYNQTLCQVNDSVVCLGVVEGEYHWHKHDEEDEFCYIVGGHLIIELAGHDPVDLRPGQGFTVPRGLQHRPIAPERTTMLMIEGACIRPTGD